MREFLDIVLWRINENISFTVGSIIFIIMGFLIARVINYLLRKVLNAYFKKRSVDIGRSYTVLQLLKYLVYVIVTITTLSIIGIKLTYLMAGSAALLVGIGIGLQQTFNDFFSGLILLVDGTMEVGNVLIFNNDYAKVKFIGLRVSKIQNRDGHIIIIPNSVLVNNTVDNLSHHQHPIRFHVEIGVSYKSDIQKVENVLLEVVKPYNKYKMNYTPSVFLVGFGDSSINFKLYFYSDQLFFIEKHKSDLRKDVFQALAKNNIEIPFPQRDLWLKTEGSETLLKSKEPAKGG